MYIIPITNCIYTYSNYKNLYIQIIPFMCYEYGVCIYPIKYKIEMIKIKIIYIYFADMKPESFGLLFITVLYCQEQLIS